MKIAVLGTGPVGRARRGRLASLGHDVVIGTRDPQATLARTEPDTMGTPPFASWHARTRRGSASPPTPTPPRGRAHRQRSPTAAAPSRRSPRPAPENLAGKVLMDIANPLDLSQGFRRR